MSWLDDLQANDPAYLAPGAGDPWQPPPTADWRALASPPETDPAASSRPVPYFPRYYTPLAAKAVAEAEAADLGPGPVPYTVTPLAEAELEAGR
jgi:hypothetical protein